MRKGFTLIELLIVLVIISILSSMAIIDSKPSIDMAYSKAEMNDAKNAITEEASFFLSNRFYDSVSGSYADSTKGMLTGDNGSKFSVSEFNTIDITVKSCGSADGYLIHVTNEKVDTEVFYDSCVDSAPREVTP